MLLVQLEFGGVLDGHHPLLLGNEAGEDVESGGLAGAGAPRDQHVQARAHAGPHELRHRVGQAAELDQVGDLVGVLGELSDGQDGPVERQRRDDDVHAGAILQPGVDHRGTLIDAPPDGGDDPVDHPAKLFFALELGGGQGQLALVLDEDLVRPVDHDLGDGRVADQLLDALALDVRGRRQPADVTQGRVDGHEIDRAVADGAGLGQRKAHLRQDRVERVGDTSRPLLPIFVFALIDVLDQPRLQAVLDAFRLDLEGGPHSGRRRALPRPRGAAGLGDVSAFGRCQRIGTLPLLDAIEE